MTKPIGTKFHQVPRALLDGDRSGLAIAAWCLYETLQTPDIHGGRLPARARRCWIADQLGISESTLDRARAELLTDDGGGPFLAREIRGRNRSALHFALNRPQETGQPYVVIPAWSLTLIRGRGRSGGEVCPETWRAYAMLCARLDPEGHDLTLARLGEWLHCSASTARRRLHALEEAGWVRIHRTDGLWMHVQAITDEHQIGTPAPDVADEVVIEEVTPITPAKSEESAVPELVSSPLPNLTTPYGAPSDSSPPDSSLPLAVGDLQHRRETDHEALRERPKPASDVGRVLGAV